MIDLCFVLILVCLYVCVCECLLQNNMRMYTSINIHRSEVHCGSAVPFGQALPGFLNTAPPSVCASAVLGALAVWIQNQKKKNIFKSKVHCGSAVRFGRALPGFPITAHRLYAFLL